MGGGGGTLIFDLSSGLGQAAAVAPTLTSQLELPPIWAGAACVLQGAQGRFWGDLHKGDSLVHGGRLHRRGAAMALASALTWAQGCCHYLPQDRARAVTITMGCLARPGPEPSCSML